MLNDVVQSAVFGKPFHRGFRADFVHAGDVIHRVAHQRQVINHAFRRHTEFRRHARLVQRVAAHGIEPQHFGVDQLGQILVPRRHHRAPARLLRALGQCADHIVGLYTVLNHHRPTQRTHRLLDRLNLRHQIIGHFRAIRFVFRVPIVAEGFAFRIKDAHGVLGRHDVAQAFEHRNHAVQRAGRLARRAAQIGQAVISAV